MCDGPPLVSDQIQIWLSPSKDADAGPPSRSGSDVAEGTVLSVEQTREPCASFAALCQGDNAPVRVEIGDGAAGVRSFAIGGASAAQFVVPLRTALGKRVTLLTRYAQGFQIGLSRGFVLSDPDGIVMAAETGRWVETLRPADHPGLEVTTGEDVCTQQDHCVVATELVFGGDTRASVAPSAEAPFRIGGGDYLARNIDGGRFAPCGFADGEHVSTWAVWRITAPIVDRGSDGEAP